MHPYVLIKVSVLPLSYVYSYFLAQPCIPTLVCHACTHVDVEPQTCHYEKNEKPVTISVVHTTIPYAVITQQLVYIVYIDHPTFSGVYSIGPGQ